MTTLGDNFGMRNSMSAQTFTEAGSTRRTATIPIGPRLRSAVRALKHNDLTNEDLAVMDHKKRLRKQLAALMTKMKPSKAPSLFTLDRARVRVKSFGGNL